MKMWFSNVHDGKKATERWRSDFFFFLAASRAGTPFKKEYPKKEKNSRIISRTLTLPTNRGPAAFCLFSFAAFVHLHHCGPLFLYSSYQHELLSKFPENFLGFRSVLAKFLNNE